MSLLRRGHEHSPLGTAAATSAPTPVHLWTRRARKDGRELVRMHCFTRADEFLVLCDVHPVDAEDGSTLQAGPYVFANRREADEFADEAGVVLEHLGCDLVASG